MTGDQVVLILAIAGVVAIVKSTAGFGYPLLMVPVLAQLIDVVDAVLIIAPSNLFLNLGIAWKLREHQSRATTLPTIVVTGTIGTIGGTLLLPQLPVQTFRLILFIILVAFLINRLSGLKFKMADPTAHRLAPVVGGVAGVFQGAAGVSGPIITPWFLCVDVERDTFIYSLAAFFAVTQIGQMIVAAIGGLYTTETVVIGLLMIPLSVVSLPIGAFLRERISATIFERIVIVLLTISATSLLLRLI